MDSFTACIAATVFGGSVVGASFLYGRTLIRNAAKDAVAYAMRADNFIDGRTQEALDYIDHVRAGWRRLDVERGFDVSALVAERALLSDMVDELRQERDDIETELAAFKVDSVEQGRIADTYAKQTKALDDVVDNLTAQINEAQLTVVLPGHLAEAHAESLIRIGLRGRVSRGPRALGRAA